MEQERRRSPRYPFAGSIEMPRRPRPKTRGRRASKNSVLNGCYVDIESPYPIGSSLAIKTFHREPSFLRRKQASSILSQIKAWV